MGRGTSTNSRFEGSRLDRPFFLCKMERDDKGGGGKKTANAVFLK